MGIEQVSNVVGYDSGDTETIRLAEDFQERAMDIINAGAHSVMISIGHKTGLFDVMAGMSASTSPAIATAAGLSERYVREWLAVMVTAAIVVYSPTRKTYELPAAHAASLTRNAELGNTAVNAQYISMMGATEDQTIRLLKTGGGTDYANYPCFHQVMAEDSEQSVVNAISDILTELIPGIDDQLRTGINVMDAGCGRGLALVALAEKYPASLFTGYDLCEDAIEEAARTAREKNLQNIRFLVKDLSDLREHARYDLITTFDAVHDQKDPQGLIARLHHALKASGVYLMQDIGGSAYLENNLEFPMASMLYAISCTHCTPVSIGQGGEGLGTMWGWETAQSMLADTGFASVEHRAFPHDPMNVWFVSRKKGSHD